VPGAVGGGAVLSSGDDQLQAHVADVWAELERAKRLRRAALRSRSATAAARAAQLAAEADKLERRLQRLRRMGNQNETRERQAWARAQRLADSKSPRDHVELLLGAIDELPIDLALEIADEALRRARRRAGQGSE
jgi:hypothetical protein